MSDDTKRNANDLLGSNLERCKDNSNQFRRHVQLGKVKKVVEI